MKLQIYSDLHLEFGYYTPVVKEPFPDLVILAGDIHQGTQAVHWINDHFLNKGIKVAYICGNHEYYNNDVVQIKRDLTAAATEWGFIFLDNDYVEFGDFVVYGGTCWTDYKLHGEPLRWYARKTAEKSMNDFRLIRDNNNRWTPDKAVEEHNGFISNLTQVKTTVKEKGKHLVVVSHHAPSRRSIAPVFAHLDAENCSYASNLENHMEGVDVWVHGHTHHSNMYTIGSTLVVSNPRGYAGHSTNPDFKDQFCVEI